MPPKIKLKFKDDRPQAAPVDAEAPTPHEEPDAPKSKKAKTQATPEPAPAKQQASKAAKAKRNGTKKVRASSQPTTPVSPCMLPLSTQQVAQAAKAKQAKILKDRQQLPMWKARLDLRYKLRHHDIMLLEGATGSGKSTQVPQFLYTEPWCKPKKVEVKNANGSTSKVQVGGCIAITQPRKVAAINLADRVRLEMGEHSPTFEAPVGHAVRFNSKIPPNMQIKFVTEGVLLQELLHDPNLRRYSCVIVDEVHERSVDVDLILGFLKLIVTGDKSGRGGIPLKVICMSASADRLTLERFFGGSYLASQKLVTQKPEDRVWDVDKYGPEPPEGHLYRKLMSDRRNDKAGKVDTVKEDTAKVGQAKKAKGDKSIAKGVIDSINEDQTKGKKQKKKGVKKNEKDDELSKVEDSPGSSNGVHSSEVEEKESKGLSWADTNEDAKQSDEERRQSQGSFSSWEGISSQEASSPWEEVASKKRGPDGDIKDSADASQDQATSQDNTAESRSANEDEDLIAYLDVEGKMHEVKEIFWNTPDLTLSRVEAVHKFIIMVHIREAYPGDILVFMPGSEEIESLLQAVQATAKTFPEGCPKLAVFPLYGALPTEVQNEAFKPVKQKNTRKVILATNIAETSVTMSGVKYVIDTGVAKVKQYRPALGLESLLINPISISSAAQRAGRAGREFPGTCWRLYSEKDFFRFPNFPEPEIKRTDIVEAVLKMKARGIADPRRFPLIDSPGDQAINDALKRLKDLGALSGEVRGEMKLTEVGQRMASLPLTFSHARVLVAAAAAKFDCVAEVIDVLSCVTAGEDIFRRRRGEIDEEDEDVMDHRKSLYRREGDIITILTTMQKYAAEQTDRKAWCDKHEVMHRTMRNAMDIRKQLRRLCQDLKMLDSSSLADDEDFEPISEETSERVLKCFMVAFKGNTATLHPGNVYKSQFNDSPISIHPSSSLYAQKCEAIMYLENVFTEKNYAKKVSRIKAAWIQEAFEKDLA